jgi:hypothetical protein
MNVPALEVQPGDWITLDDGSRHEVVETRWVEVDHLHALVTLTVDTLEGREIEIAGSDLVDVERPASD